jgi:hypothetical protein
MRGFPGQAGERKQVQGVSKIEIIPSNKDIKETELRLYNK